MKVVLPTEYCPISITDGGALNSASLSGWFITENPEDSSSGLSFSLYARMRFSSTSLFSCLCLVDVSARFDFVTLIPPPPAAAGVSCGSGSGSPGTPSSTSAMARYQRCEGRSSRTLDRYRVASWYSRGTAVLLTVLVKEVHSLYYYYSTGSRLSTVRTAYRLLGTQRSSLV